MTWYEDDRIKLYTNLDMLIDKANTLSQLHSLANYIRRNETRLAASNAAVLKHKVWAKYSKMLRKAD